MRVSVIIPVFNEETYISKCLESIFAQSELPDEVIVVDNNCTDKTVEIARKFPTVRVIKEKTQGMTPARNKGFNNAKYDIIARTDADTIVPKNWIREIKKHFEKDSELVALSGPSRMYGVNALKEKAYFRGEILYFQMFKKIFKTDCLSGPNMAIRKIAWKKIKTEVCLVDTLVHEDIDLAIHAAHFGKVLIDLQDKGLAVNTSFRRWKKVKTHWEYPYRYFRTIQHHTQSLHGLKTSTQMMEKVLPKPRKIMKRIRTTASVSLKRAHIFPH